MPLHLLKLAVGIRDAAHLRAVQALRAERAPPLRHQTRMAPRRADEILAGGSIYWVIGGAVLLRQGVRGIVADVWDDGSACTGLVLDPALVPVEPRRVKPFQGWRYLTHADAPADIVEGIPVRGVLPEVLRAELRALCLI